MCAYTHRHTDTQTQTDTHTDRQTDTHTHTHRRTNAHQTCTLLSRQTAPTKEEQSEKAQPSKQSSKRIRDSSLPVPTSHTITTLSMLPEQTRVLSDELSCVEKAQETTAAECPRSRQRTGSSVVASVPEYTLSGTSQMRSVLSSAVI